LLEESDVSLDLVQKSLGIIHVKLQQAFLVFSESVAFARQQISVFHRLILALCDDSVVPAAFEVVHFVDSIGNIRGLDCVLHQ